MKKGFTLIELLAVIVILAIIALIAVPIVLNIINDTKESATLRSAEMYLDALELSVAQAILKGQNIQDGTYNILESGNLCLEIYDSTNKACVDSSDNGIEIDILEADVKGEAPKEGTITITNGSITGLNIILNEKEIMKNSKNQMVYVKFLDEVCEHVSGTQKTEGAKYTCKVDPNKGAYTFYVLNTRNAVGEIITESSTDKEAVSINLIMDRNINSDGTPMDSKISKDDSEKYNLVEWINQSDYELAGGRNWNDYTGLNDFGPITSMNFISEATQNWTNTNEMTIDSFDSFDSSGNLKETKEMKTYNTYARMPYYNEVSNITKEKIWLIDYLHGYDDEDKGIVGREHGINGLWGYWTLSAHVNSDNENGNKNSHAWTVSYEGNLSWKLVDNSSGTGVRPVINLKI